MGWGSVQKIFRMQTLQNRAPIWVRDQGEDRVVENSTRVMPSTASSGWFEGFGFMFTLGSSVPYPSSAIQGHVFMRLLLFHHRCLSSGSVRFVLPLRASRAILVSFLPFSRPLDFLVKTKSQCQLTTFQCAALCMWHFFRANLDASSSVPAAQLSWCL